MKYAQTTLKAMALSLLLSGCATSGTSGSKDKAAAERSKDYFTNVSYVPAGTRSSASCALPPGAEKKAASKKVAGPSKDWKDLAARASQCIGEKNWRTLESIANVMGQMDIDSPWGAYFLSVAAEGQGDNARALWMVDLAQKKAGGGSGLFLYQRGRVLVKMQETVKGMADIKKAVAVEPKLVDAHLFLAEIHHRDMEWDQAAPHYKAALESDSKNYRALIGLAEARLQSGAGAEAADLYARAMSAQPSQLQPWVRLGYIYESVQKNNELALNTYKGLRTSLDSGSVKEKPAFDLNAKIKALEASAVKPANDNRQPAQASSQTPDPTRSKK